MAKITVGHLKMLESKFRLGEITYNRMVELLNEKASEPEWISVKDRLPENGNLVTGITIDGTIETCEFKRGMWFYNGEQYGNSINITHWMPLPNKPVN